MSAKSEQSPLQLRKKNLSKLYDKVNKNGIWNEPEDFVAGAIIYMNHKLALMIASMEENCSCSVKSQIILNAYLMLC